VHCEFCGQGYRLDQTQVDALFTSGSAPRGPELPGLQ
jgi:hypothetical protein